MTTEEQPEELTTEEQPEELTTEEQPVGMSRYTFGKAKVLALMLDRETVQMMAEKHGAEVKVNGQLQRYFALPGLLPDDEETRFCVGDWYIERKGRNPGTMTDEEFQAAKGD